MGTDLLLIPKNHSYQNVYFHCIFSLEVACVGPGNSLCRPRVKGIAEFDYHVLPSDLMSFWKFDHYTLWVNSDVIRYFSAYKPWAMTFDQPLCGRAYLLEGGGGGGGGGVICRSKKATEKTDMRRNENLYLKTWIKCIVLFIVLFIKKIGIKPFLQDMRGAYTWIKTSVKEKEGLSAGEGAYRQRNSTQPSPIWINIIFKFSG